MLFSEIVKSFASESICALRSRSAAHSRIGWLPEGEGGAWSVHSLGTAKVPREEPARMRVSTEPTLRVLRI